MHGLKQNGLFRKLVVATRCSQSSAEGGSPIQTKPTCKCPHSHHPPSPSRARSSPNKSSQSDLAFQPAVSKTWSVPAAFPRVCASGASCTGRRLWSMHGNDGSSPLKILGRQSQTEQRLRIAQQLPTAGPTFKFRQRGRPTSQRPTSQRAFAPSRGSRPSPSARFPSIGMRSRLPACGQTSFKSAPPQKSI